jgi:hypothetical protein
MARVTTLAWTLRLVQQIEKMRADGHSWATIGERYGCNGTHMRGRYYERKRALQPTRSGGCDVVPPYAAVAAPSD